MYTHYKKKKSNKGVYCFMGTEFWFREMRRVLSLDNGAGHHIVNAMSATEIQAAKGLNSTCELPQFQLIFHKIKPKEKLE